MLFVCHFPFFFLRTYLFMIWDYSLSSSPILMNVLLVNDSILNCYCRVIHYTTQGNYKSSYDEFRLIQMNIVCWWQKLANIVYFLIFLMIIISTSLLLRCTHHHAVPMYETQIKNWVLCCSRLVLHSSYYRCSVWYFSYCVMS